MVNGNKDSDAAQAERALAISYAPVHRRDGIVALLQLDGALGRVLRTTREPLVGQMRLAWWRDSLVRLDTVRPAGDPVLAAIADHVTPYGVAGVQLAGMADGWEILLEERLSHSALHVHIARRGGSLFQAAARLLGQEDQRAWVAGEGWAAADLASNLSDPMMAREARALAEQRLSAALSGRWPRPLRAIGGLAWLARMDLEARYAPGHPARVGRLLRFRLFG